MEKRTILMKDGRSVVFGKRARMLYRPVRDHVENLIGMAFDFSSGDTRQIYLAEVIERDEMMARGLKEKLSNESSKEDVVSAGDMLKAWDVMAARIRAGVAFDRVSGPVNRVDGILLEAFIDARFEMDGANDPEAVPLTQAEAVKILMDLGPEGRRILTVSDEMRPYVEAVAKRRAATINPTDVLTKVGLGKKAVEATKVESPAVESPAVEPPTE
jgi:hypothetical protein